MNLYDNAHYMEDVKNTSSMPLPWDELRDKSVMLSGATGMIGSFLVDVLMESNLAYGLNCTVYALGRDEEKAKARFSKYNDDRHLVFIPYDVRRPLIRDELENVDYILHLASNTHPLQYATEPISTITTNIIGLQNLLDFAVRHSTKRFVFASSVEIYGENRGDVEKFSEDYCGYINSNTLRAGYPESKRCGEALCQAYIKEKNLDIVIPRLSRVYGPTLLKTDTKALSQFLHKAVSGENIILKSEGKQFYSYLYVADIVSGILTILLKGKKGEAYNVSDPASDITLKNLAEMIAKISEGHVEYDIPEATESAGYSKATKAVLDAGKLTQLGWEAAYDIENGVKRTIDILRYINN